MNKKLVFSLIVSFITIGFVVPSFAQNAVIPAEPVSTSTMSDGHTKMKPKMQHKHRKLMGKRMKKGMHKKTHKKLEVGKVMDDQVNKVTN